MGLLLPPLLLSKRLGFTRIVEATIFRCTLEDSSSFQRSQKDISEYSMMVLVLDDDFEFILVTFH